MEHLTAEINRVHRQQTQMWRWKVEGLQKQRDKLQAEIERLKEQVKFLTKYDADVDGLQAENEKLSMQMKKLATRIGEEKDRANKYWRRAVDAEQALKGKE